MGVVFCMEIGGHRVSFFNFLMIVKTIAANYHRFYYVNGGQLEGGV